MLWGDVDADANVRQARGLKAAGCSSAVSVHVCKYALAVPGGWNGKLKVLTIGQEKAL